MATISLKVVNMNREQRREKQQEEKRNARKVRKTLAKMPKEKRQEIFKEIYEIWTQAKDKTNRLNMEDEENESAT